MVLVSSIAGRWSIIATATDNFSIKKLRNCSCLLKWRLIIFWARKEMKITWKRGGKRMKLNWLGWWHKFQTLSKCFFNGILKSDQRLGLFCVFHGGCFPMTAMIVSASNYRKLHQGSSSEAIPAFLTFSWTFKKVSKKWISILTTLFHFYVSLCCPGSEKISGSVDASSRVFKKVIQKC